MLNILMKGRMGNQMFQYATVRAFQEKFNIKDKINIVFQHKKYTKREPSYLNELNSFNLNDEKCNIEEKIELSLWQIFLYNIYFFIIRIIRKFFNQGKYEKIQKMYEDIIQKFYNKNGLYLYQYGFYKFEDSKDVKNKLFRGYFETPKYFNAIREQLIEEFTPKHEKLEKNMELYNIIEHTESVCISIRRGDFLNNKYRDRFYVCTPEYFYKAMETIKEKVKNPQFIVFSDDINWVRKNMNFPETTLFESGNDPTWEKLRLMYSCKHFILSNSTFSWWAQYLSKSKNKIVISPNTWRWLGFDPKDLYTDDFILINVNKYKRYKNTKN